MIVPILVWVLLREREREREREMGTGTGVTILAWVRELCTEHVVTLSLLLKISENCRLVNPFHFLVVTP